MPFWLTKHLKRDIAGHKKSTINNAVALETFITLRPRLHGQCFSAKILCHRNIGNKFVFTHGKSYLDYLARSPLSQIFDNETSPQNSVYMSIFFCDKPTLSKKNRPYLINKI